jgi:hypothetical protein
MNSNPVWNLKDAALENKVSVCLLPRKNKVDNEATLQARNQLEIQCIQCPSGLEFEICNTINTGEKYCSSPSRKRMWIGMKIKPVYHKEHASHAKSNDVHTIYRRSP